IGQALGMEKAGVNSKVVAVIGDSTFLHSGITGLVNAVYDKGKITVVILDNRTTAMTGHQEHPGTGITVKGVETQAVELEPLVRGIGVKNVKTVNAFNVRELRTTLKSALDSNELSVLIVRGTCAVRARRANQRVIDVEKCDNCNTCLMLGCPAIQTEDGQVFIDVAQCVGDACTLCEQVCPHKAISAGAVLEEAK
ncbi:MAG: thiamine pyrophosphate-dependent enzyme, partial [Dehalococcoidia bacterium]|nr:thiamine pyrophosphate-dependent enzyme [Dehalococcoidia bacterium]